MSRSKQVKCRGGRNCWVCGSQRFEKFLEARTPTADLGSYDFDHGLVYESDYEYWHCECYDEQECYFHPTLEATPLKVKLGEML